MTKDFEVVQVAELDDDVVELGRTAFGKPSGQFRDYLEWKYLRNPYRTEPLVYIARDRSGRAVAMRGFYGARWSTPAGIVDIPCADDFAVASAYRTSGVAAELMRAALADLPSHGIDCVINASGGRITVLQSLAMGWRSVLMVDPLDRGGRHARLGGTFTHLRSRARRLHRSLAALDDIDGVTSMPDAEELARLAARTGTGSAVRHLRDAPFYRWRYANPQREYRFLVVESEGRIAGFLAIGRQRPRPDTLPLYVADWEGESPEIRSRLLERALQLCGPTPIRVWAASASHETRSLLDRLGFEPAQSELRAQGMPCILLRVLDSGDPDLAATLARSTWDVRLIDSMHG